MNKDFERKGEPVVVLRDPSSDDTLDVEVGERDLVTTVPRLSRCGPPTSMRSQKATAPQVAVCRGTNSTQRHESSTGILQASADFLARPSGVQPSRSRFLGSLVATTSPRRLRGIVGCGYGQRLAYRRRSLRVTRETPCLLSRDEQGYTIHNFFEARCTRAMAGALLGIPRATESLGRVTRPRKTARSSRPKKKEYTSPTLCSSVTTSIRSWKGGEGFSGASGEKVGGEGALGP